MNNWTLPVKVAALILASVVNVAIAWLVAYMVNLHTFLSIGFNMRNEEPWFTQRDIIILLAVNVAVGLVAAFVSSFILTKLNQLLVPSNVAKILSKLVFVLVGVALMRNFLPMLT